MANVLDGRESRDLSSMNEQEFLARVRRTEQAYAERAAARQQAAAARARKDPLDAETAGRRIKRFANIGQQPLSPGERELAIERVLGKNDLVGITFVQRMLRAIAATGRIVIRTPDGRGGYGTGFMVAPGVLLTNNHVLTSESIASLSRIQFEYEEREGAVLVEPVEFQLRPDLFFVTNALLDFTFVAVADTNQAGAELASYGWVPLIESEGKVAVNEPVNLVQHPSGERKRLAIRENLLVDLLPDFLHYEADTAPGSSGSPVFSDMWEVVGLHHSGVPQRDEYGRILTRSGTLWQASMGEDAVAWKANEGVRVSRIMQTLKSAQVRNTQERFRQGVFDAGKQPLPDLHSVSEARPPVSGAILGGPVINSDGTATWTLPLVVTLGLGGTSTRLGATVAPAPRPPQAEPAGHSPVPPPGTAPRAVDQEVERALAEFERTREQPYYEEAADRSDRQAYYAGLPDGTQRAPSVQALSSLIERTHTNQVRYDSGRSIYTFADLHEDGVLRSIYSGVTFDPREAIEEVVRLDESIKAAEAQAADGRFTERMLEQIELLEATSPFNCEHVVPQSWFNRREPMRGDMHHLFACGSRCNSFRGNIPYFDFPDFEEAIMDDCGKRERVDSTVQGFEPNRGKAIVARATLYFLVRYPRKVSSKSLPVDRISTVVGWHKASAPERYELHRNQAIFRRQNNRNPFIDFPDWADDIEFDKLLADT